MEGIGIEFEQRARARNASYDKPQSISQGITAELLKVLMDNWIEEAGIKYLLHTTTVDVLREEDKLTGTVVQTKARAGLQ